MLKMLHIGKSFTGTHVLEDVSFDVAAGEVHVLAGENGAGKSTLIKILAGAYRDYEGEIRLDDRAVRFHSPHDAARHGIAVIYQELSLIPSMSVRDNLFLVRDEQRDRTRELLARLSLDIDPERLVEEFPIAVQQLIEIAKALAMDARVIVMDEPTSALSEAEAARLFDAIADLKARGCGIVYISHKMEEIYRLADRITVLRDGKLVGTSKAVELPRDRLIQWMVGREISRQFPSRDTKRGGERLTVRHFQVPGRVDDVSFSVRAGEILGIAGLQGAGNSSLLHGLFGGTTRGEVSVNGSVVDTSSVRRAMASGFALLTSDRKQAGIVPDMDVTSNFSLAAFRQFWVDTKMEDDAAQKHVSNLSIRVSSLRQPMQTLSGGNQQKVLLARWLETAPQILLLDEPTRGVDVGAKQEIYELMNRWTADGMSILLITSEMQELLAMSDRIMVMHRGRVTAEFDKNMATQENVLQAAMGH